MAYVLTISWPTLETINKMLHGKDTTSEDRQRALSEIQNTGMIALNDTDFKGLNDIIQNVRKIENKV